MSATRAELVDRIWSRDPSVWTGRDEAHWLGWLDEPLRMRERVHELVERVARLDFDRVCLLGMGGSSLAPLVLARIFDADRFDVLDTTHASAIRRVEVDGTLFVASSKSGTTVETRSQLEYFRDLGVDFIVITDPGSELERLGAPVFHGEPTIGGRYSALSMFGLVPAALMGVDLERFLARAEETVEACRVDDGNPGYELGLRLGEGWQADRDKVCIDTRPSGFGLWAEQLLAESTGKDGKGLVPAPGEPPEGADRQRGEVLLDDPYDLASEFFRWEFATAVAGHMLGINPFDQPDVQAAKDKTNEVLGRGEADVEARGSVDELLTQAQPGDYVAILAFADPARVDELTPLVERAHETGCVVTTGVGPRFLHSTGQLHKGGPNTGLFVQVVDEVGEELPIPGRDFGFGRLIQAQAAGDLAALEERERRVIRLRLEDIA